MNERLRLLQVSKWYYPALGGIEKVVKDLAEELSSRTDMQILVCRDKKLSCEEVVEGVPVTRAGILATCLSVPLSLPFLTRFRRLSKKADLVLVHAPFPLADLAVLLSGYRGKVCVLWHNDIVRQKKMLRFYRPLMRRFFKRADAIVCTSPEFLEHSPQLKPFRDKCRAIRLGLDTDSYLAAAPCPILQRGLSDPKNKKILFCGRLIYYKGVDVLLSAFAGVEGAELFLVGEGPLMPALKKQAADLCLLDRVHFLGRLSETELRGAYRDCDFLVLPSVTRSEGFGLVQLEAMIYQKPVINTDLPTGVPTASLDGVTGFTVPCSDVSALQSAMQTLVSDDALRARFGQAAAQRVLREFSRRKMAEEYEKLFHTLCD